MPNGKKKQDLVEGDATGSAKLTVWEEEIGKLKEGPQLRFGGSDSTLVLGKKFLSTSKGTSSFKLSEDVGDVADVEETEDEEAS